MKNKVKIISDKNGDSLLDTLQFRSYEETIGKIKKKVGDRPKMPRYLPKGIWTEQSIRVLEERYLLKDVNGKIIETPDGMCWRVAWDIASAESVWGKSKNQVKKITEAFYKLLSSHEFLPNSPTLMNAGTGNGLQYSACFVLPVEDSLVGIFDAIKYQALIHQTGGGTGFSFSRLRGRGSMVKSSRGTASGPVSFMRIFDAATNEIKQGGKRRGANMGILRVDHPDIMEFIHCKEEGGITNFNISVAITEEFMKAYEAGREYDLIDPKTGEVRGKLDAIKVFDDIAQGAWRTGDPGLIFIDRINTGTPNPVPGLGPIESTNPCGEQPLYPYDSCNLGSIFLNNFVIKDKGKKVVDWERLRSVSALSARFLDDVIEMNPYPMKEIRQTSLAIRRIGLGVGGWADMLCLLGIPYDSNEAIELAEKVMKTIYEASLTASQELAVERGTFPLFGKSIYKKDIPRRNATVTTIAPTGSISIIAGASSGIEPLFAVAFQHIVKDASLDRTLSFVNPIFESVAKERGVWSEDLKEKVAENGVVRSIEELPEDLRMAFGTAHEIHHNWHIKHQAAFQKYTENAVSKTINMKSSAGEDEIKNAYLLAWETGCNGVTVFRDGCKSAQVLNVGIKEKKEEVIEEKSPEVQAIERPFVVSGATYKINTPVGTAFVTLNTDEKGNPLELFINVGKAGSDVAAMAEALGRTISIALRFPGNLNSKDRAFEIAEQLAGIGGRRSVGFGPNKILSLPDAISMAISVAMGFRINGYLHHAEKLLQLKVQPNGGAEADEHKANGESNGVYTNGTSTDMLNTAVLEEKTQIESEEEMPDQLSFEALKIKGDICPTCGVGAMVYQEGCSKCYACGHSEC
ncbi:MAG: Ribonucleoside-diphosphate reductase [Candidatus Woesebacteria bacterium GW2011_GWC1_38_13]|uniref:Vitamin B12-dependent ribonucleotide reductase n=2 Tax=Candidatus Woeseibacteriota TaxID=1752722 RepID=A0A0G0L2U8_9BACT|nr:MAG: Ribonucleoside-diphosphate reductase [Candidatus Woesebacteria bacterium GW2011_GWC1_38_13]